MCDLEGAILTLTVAQLNLLLRWLAILIEASFTKVLGTVAMVDGDSTAV